MSKLIYNSPFKKRAHVECPDLETICRPVFVLEKHLSVIRKGPTAPPKLEMYKFDEEVMEVSEEYGDADSGIIGNIKSSFTGEDMWQTWNFRKTGEDESIVGDGNISVQNDYSDLPSHKRNTFGTGIDGADISGFFHSDKSQKKNGDQVIIPIDISINSEDWEINDHLIVEHTFQNQWGEARKAVCRLSIDNDYKEGTDNTVGTWGVYDDQQPRYIEASIISITGNFPLLATSKWDIYNVRLVQNPAIFKHKFPKFGYRYKYEDGEYSVFSPWSEVAFLPETFDYLPKKGYNLGMENALRSLRIMDFVPKDIPKDVIQVDLLYKESNSPSVYTVASFKEDDPIQGGPQNYWNTAGTGANFGNYKIKSELIHKVVPSNQMLRPWDNVPRRALAQEITANRLIFANYVQSYDLLDKNGQEVIPEFSTQVRSIDRSITASSPKPGLPGKSLKSMRTYQLGIVYRDRYGRETPVLTAKSGSFVLDKSFAAFQNRIKVQMQSQPPYWAESYTFYIKETANEYYNLAMDRWYDAEDGGVWLSFPSVERNKISDRTTLILKKQHDSNNFTADKTRYKVLSIKDDAPTFIKTDLKYWGSLPMMLPPPGWGDLGTWDTGMFYPTGLPLPKRMFLDIYAEYWDQSVFKKLDSSNGAQIRIIQSEGQASAYNAGLEDNTNKSRWYDVSNVEYIGAPAQTYTETSEDADGNQISTEVEVAGQLEQLVRISLRKSFGDDVGFCKPDYDLTGGGQFSQTDDNELDRGLSLEVRTKEVKNKAQFEGRFFVKVLRDYNIQQNIVNPQQNFTQKYQVLQKKNISYICMGHPGLQDWNRDTKYFVAPALNYDGPVTQLGSSPGHLKLSSRSNGTFGWGTGPIATSSLSAHHANTGASYVTHDNGPAFSPITSTPYADNIGWPIGPGIVTDGAYADGKVEGKDYWRQTFIDNLYNEGDSFRDTPIRGVFTTQPAYRGVSEDWPSQMPDMWNPYMSMTNDVSATTNYAHMSYSGTDGPYIGNSASNYHNQGKYTGGNHVLDLSKSSTFLNTLTNGYDPGNTWDDNSYMAGANPYSVPAIWGDQSDFIQNYNNGVFSTTGTFVPTWKEGTSGRLKSDWYHLWRGRDDVMDSWPLGRFHPNRWFIDKAGAAKGYSGNGIWDDGTVSYMDLSYWGIGSENDWNRKNSHLELMKMNQPTEIGFADAMSTIGTQFRFQQDPDQTIYTITNVGVEDNIYNYEAPQGVWGIEDPDDPTVTNGGIELGYQRQAPWGGSKASGPLAGGVAFISDLFSKNKKETGGAPYNKRVRFTLTLDKLIGQEGASSFHPITNHVREDGQANMKNTRRKYNQGLAGGAFSENTGATPVGSDSNQGDMDLYNLHSFWNTDAAADFGTNFAFDCSAALAGCVDQPSNINDDFYTEHYTEAYIGLHERGLNETTIEIITPYRGEEDSIMSTNPAVWETEPLEDVGLDIYYAASSSYPITVDRYRYDNKFDNGPDELDVYGANWYDYGYRGEEVIPVGSRLRVTYNSSTYYAEVCAVQNDIIWLKAHEDSVAGSAFMDGVNDYTLPALTSVIFSTEGSGASYGAGYDNQQITTRIIEPLGNPAGASGVSVYRIHTGTHSKQRQLGYFNCYSYGTGVETNRVKDDYNAVTIDKGVKASMPLAEQYKEERKGSGLIFSGIYNSTSGVNSTNQFIQAEPITKDLNPINGSIQKLHTRDTDLVTFCENKVFKILAKKDALFNADGNTNVTSTNKVLGQTIPFTGEYGISKNPESFASESYRVYFADKARGAILRLSRDGITPISDKGMKNWFKDNLRFATSIIGSYDDREDQYNVTLETEDIDRHQKAYTLSYTEARKGWVSFKSFITQGGISHKNIYYTFPSNSYSLRQNLDPWGVSYYLTDQSGVAEAWQHNLDIRVSRQVVGNPAVNSNSLVVEDNSRGAILVGMNVIGNGVPIDTLVASVACNGSTCSITLDKNCSIQSATFGVTGHIVFTSPRNSFYSIKDHYSMVKVLFNQDQGSVKTFKTLDYEGSQAKTIFRPDNTHQIEGINVGQVYYDNIEKLGWFAYHLNTDMQVGKVHEFKDKENKWYNFIRGYGTVLNNDSFDLQPAGDGIYSHENFGVAESQHDQLDTGAFSLQGLGFASAIGDIVSTFGCIGGMCREDVNGIYDSRAKCLSSGCEQIPGCVDVKANNYNPNATVGDNSCTYDGCTDPLATNFDSTASGDDGSCTYAVTWDCDCFKPGDCYDPGDGTGAFADIALCRADCSANSVVGCTSRDACNYDPNANCDDGSCTFGSFPGCTDNSFYNYDPNADCDDGSCAN